MLKEKGTKGGERQRHGRKKKGNDLTIRDVTRHLTTNCFVYTLELNICVVVLVQSVWHRKQVTHGGKKKKPRRKLISIFLTE